MGTKYFYDYSNVWLSYICGAIKLMKLIHCCNNIYCIYYVNAYTKYIVNKYWFLIICQCWHFVALLLLTNSNYHKPRDILFCSNIRGSFFFVISQYKTNAFYCTVGIYRQKILKTSMIYDWIVKNRVSVQTTLVGP